MLWFEGKERERAAGKLAIGASCIGDCVIGEEQKKATNCWIDPTHRDEAAMNGAQSVYRVELIRN